jgi:hypothetical protein
MTRRTGHLLFDEAPIAVNPSAIRLFGLAEAVLLQQLYYRLCWKEKRASQYAAHFIDGRFWVHWSTAELQQEAPLGRTSTDPYKRVTKRLREIGILLVEQHRRSQWDRTNWYSIDLDAFDSYVATHGGSSNDSTGGNATSRDAAPPPIVRSEPASSTGEKPAGHIQSKKSSKTSSKTTTTTLATKASEHRASGAEEVALNALDLSGLPARLHEDVRKIVGTRPDAQQFLDLLSARLARDGELPAEQHVKNPRLWLRKTIEKQDTVDFSEADRLNDQREKRAEAARRESARAAQEREDQLLQDAARRARMDRAQAFLADMPPADRDALKAAILANRLIGSQRAKAVEAIEAGRLPDGPMALHAVLQVLESLGKQQPRGAT